MGVGKGDGIKSGGLMLRGCEGVGHTVAFQVIGAKHTTTSIEFCAVERREVDHGHEKNQSNQL